MKKNVFFSFSSSRLISRGGGGCFFLGGGSSLSSLNSFNCSPQIGFSRLAYLKNY